MRWRLAGVPVFFILPYQFKAEVKEPVLLFVALEYSRLSLPLAGRDVSRDVPSSKEQQGTAVFTGYAFRKS